MIIGVEVIGVNIPIGAIDPDTSSASFDPYAAVFDAPDQSLIILVEAEVRTDL